MCLDEKTKKKLIFSLSLLTTSSASQGGKQSASDYRWALLPNWSHHLYCKTASTLFLLRRKRANTDLWPLNSSFIVCLSSFLQSAPSTLLHDRRRGKTPLEEKSKQQVGVYLKVSKEEGMLGKQKWLVGEGRRRQWVKTATYSVRRSRDAPADALWASPGGWSGLKHTLTAISLPSGELYKDRP